MQITSSIGSSAALSGFSQMGAATKSTGAARGDRRWSMETSEGRGGWSWRKTLVVALAIGAVIALAVVLVASAGDGSGGLY
jgi:hypothetical protein